MERSRALLRFQVTGALAPLPPKEARKLSKRGFHAETHHVGYGCIARQHVTRVCADDSANPSPKAITGDDTDDTARSNSARRDLAFSRQDQ